MTDTITHDSPRVIPGRNGGRLTPFTSENARDMVRLREEKRIRLYNEGAKRAVQDLQLIREYGDDAHLVERAMTLQTIASTPDAGKAAVLADTALQRAQGYDTGKRDSSSGGNTVNIVALPDDVVRVLDDLRAMMQGRTILAHLHDTIDEDNESE